MALKAVHVSDVPNLDQVQENASSILYSNKFSRGIHAIQTPPTSSKFLVIGHRGSGMNMLQSSDKRMKAIKENTILSFNNAAKFPLDFVEFDVQVTKDDCPIIFHDNFIITEEEQEGGKGKILEKRVTELTLDEFLCCGPQRESKSVGKSLFRKTKDGRICNWVVENDDSACTLRDAFQMVDMSLGFNIELKFDDYIVYEETDLIHVLEVVLQVVYAYAEERPVIFSTFQPDAARLMRRLQKSYPVFFLTEGGDEIYPDVRRNSLDEAMKLCLENGLEGIVSDVKAVYRNPGAISRIKGANLSLLTYGQLNNVPEAVYMQHVMGVDGVIVDLVREISEVVCNLIKPGKGEGEANVGAEGEMLISRPKFSQLEISFLLKLIPELIQH